MSLKSLVFPRSIKCEFAMTIYIAGQCQGAPAVGPIAQVQAVNQGTAQHSTAQHSTAQHSTAQHSTAQHSTAQHSTAQHSTAQHSTAQHSTAQHSTAQHSTAQHSTAPTCASISRLTKAPDPLPMTSPGNSVAGSRAARMTWHRNLSPCV